MLGFWTVIVVRRDGAPNLVTCIEFAERKMSVIVSGRT